jgi:hypothetical protein
LLFSEKRFAEADSLLSSIKETTGETAQLLVMMGNSKSITRILLRDFSCWNPLYPKTLFMRKLCAV